MDVVPEDRGLRRNASERLMDMLTESDDPVLAYKARILVGMSPDSSEGRMLQACIADSPMPRALLRVLDQDAKTVQHTYRKWHGPHWTLVFLALETALTRTIRTWLPSRRCPVDISDITPLPHERSARIARSSGRPA